MPTPVLKCTCPLCEGSYDGKPATVGAQIQCPTCQGEFIHEPQLGEFLLRRRLGRGGTCTVYEAQDLQRRQLVALKLLNELLHRDVEAVLRFFDEAETTELFNHAHIIKLHGYGDHAGTVYLSMEYLPGGSLDDRLQKEGRLSELAALEVGIQVARALAHAASRGIVHRDVKPGNILFDAGGRAKLADFGLSVKTTTPNPNSGEVWGTAHYVPPERLRGEPEDFRSDMYGLAASLFHALTGQTICGGKTVAEVMEIQALEETVSLREAFPEISAPTALAIERALSRNPADRYPSHQAFIGALEKSRAALVRRSWVRQLGTSSGRGDLMRQLSIGFFSLAFSLAGSMHFINPQPFLDIVPSYLPAPGLLVAVSGLAEIAGGVGLLTRFRQPAGYGLILLLLAVLPANVYMLTDHPFILGKLVPEWILLFRLPLQFVLMAWIYWSIRNKPLGSI